MIARYPNSPILKDWAEKLVQLNNKDIFKGSVVPSAILFIEDTITGAPKEPAPGSRRRRKTSSPKPKKSQKPFDIKAMHPALAERLDADYMVTWYKLRSVYMDVNKLRVYLLETLMRIKPGGGLNPPDLKTFKAIAKAAGVDYEDKQFLGLDVLEERLIKGTTQQKQLEIEHGEPKTETAGSVDHEAPAAGDSDSPPADGWQPEAPYVKPEEAAPLEVAAGTDPEH